MCAIRRSRYRTPASSCSVTVSTYARRGSPLRGRCWVAAPTSLRAASLAHWRPVRAASPRVGSQHRQPRGPRSSLWVPLFRGHGQWSHTAYLGWGLSWEAAGPAQQTMCPWLGPGLEVPSGSLLTLPPGPHWKQSHTRGPQQSQAGVPDLPAGPWEVRACSGRLTPVGTVHPRTAAAKARRNPATRTGGKAVNPPPRGTAGRARLTQHAEKPAAAAPTHRGTRENRKLMRS